MRSRIGLFAPILVASLGFAPSQPVLNADSLYDLHDSADRVKLRMDLSPREFASLDHALEVLVGERARRVVNAIENSPRQLPASVRLAAEAHVLAPIDGMTYDRLVTAAVEKTIDRRTGLLGDLRSEKAAAPNNRRQLLNIEVVDSVYWADVASGERAIDFTIRNGSDEAISALVLDCRLVDDDRHQARERGTCRLDFEQAIPAGGSGTATVVVGWHTRQRLGWTIDARPIRAFDQGGEALWQVGSETDPNQPGPVVEIEHDIARLDSDLDTLRPDRSALR